MGTTHVMCTTAEAQLRLRSIQRMWLRLEPGGDRALSTLVDLLRGFPGRQKIQGKVALLLFGSHLEVAQRIHSFATDFLKSRNLFIRQGPAPSLGNVEGIPGICVEGMLTHALAPGDVMHPGLEMGQEFQPHIVIHPGSLSQWGPDQVLIAHQQVALLQIFGQSMDGPVDV